MIESAAFNKNIKISVSVSKDLYVFADKNMLDSILRNLISNAIKFSFKGGKLEFRRPGLKPKYKFQYRIKELVFLQKDFLRFLELIDIPIPLVPKTNLELAWD